MMRIFLLYILITLLKSSAIAQNLTWAKSLAGRGTSTVSHLDPGNSYCVGIDVDKDNNVYITGYCDDTIDFDPGLAEYLLIGGYTDIYFAKYNPNGDLLWAHVIKSPGGNYPADIEIDGLNNIILTGQCANDADFDLGPGVSMLQISPGNSNYIFIAKYDSDGNFIWAKNMQTAFGTFSNSVTVDHDDNIYITGHFYNDIDLDPSSDTAFVYSNQTGLYFAKYDSSGDFLWGKSIPGTGSFSDISKIRISDAGNIYFTGYFSNTVDFDPGPAIVNVAANTTADRFFAKYDGNGNFIWVKSIDTNNNGVFTVGRSINLAVDPYENVYVTGDFTGTVDFDPAPPLQLLSCPNTYGTFIGKYDPSGNFIWVKGLFGGYIVANNIELDCYSNIIIAGTFTSADFDPGPGVDFIISNQPSAFMNFFAQYDSAGNYFWAKRIGNCGYGGGVVHPTLAIKDQSQYMAGGFKQTGDFDPGPDSAKLTMSGVGMNSYFAKYSSSYNLNIGSDTSICNKDTLFLDVRTPNAIYQWQDNTNKFYYNATSAGTYWVMVTVNNCHFTDSVTVDFHNCDTSKLKMPNVFTPNDDFKNDTFHPIEAENIEQYDLKIYNRWGQKLFETVDLNEGWNGRYNGMECDAGTYYFILNYKFVEEEFNSMKGFMTLLR